MKEIYLDWLRTLRTGIAAGNASDPGLLTGQLGLLYGAAMVDGQGAVLVPRPVRLENAC